ncbi:NAD(P)H-dependent oxidoreductase [Agrobacterium sp. a22-2]|uniref:NADPH-dependent FMN reductase n=1 Tax=Agrobacterium sp. a22-2 TaxID=2283840 RepID=UPI00144815AF|nr:NADPH-dependent FMN reductase [Agrobacterium sp. a22-2]NKN36122.1 NAD(P)H-dependent oxidoreductase [Agrobacterium sp. a22-2]
MVKLLGISGSLRKGSYNTALLNAAIARAGSNVTLSAGTIQGIPLYDGDLEATEGIPAAVQALKSQIEAADGVILFTPEYNNSIPGVFKNAIDWLSRPSSDIAKVFGNRPFAIAGTSPGNFGTQLSQNAWLTVLHTLGARTWSGKRLMVPRAGEVFDAEGRLIDEATAKRLDGFVAGFAEFVSP